jgi:hypothetical protein
VTNVHIFYIFVEDKVGTVFVDGIVGEMHEFIVKVFRTRSFVLLCGKSSQSFLIDINSKGINA